VTVGLHRAQIASALIIASGAGCSRTTVLDLPSGASWILQVRRPARGGPQLVGPKRSHPGVSFAYDEATDLDDEFFGLSDDWSVTGTATLRLAQPCEPEIDGLVWFAHLRHGVLSETATRSDGDRLTSSELDAGCRAIGVELRGLPPATGTTAPCLRGSPAGPRVGLDPRPSVAGPACAASDCALTAGSARDWRLACPGAPDAVIYAPPGGFGSMRLPVIRGAAAFAPGPDRDPSAGYLGDLALVGDAVVVAERASAGPPCATAARAMPSALAFLDRTRGDLLRTATAPPCLERITPMPALEGAAYPAGTFVGLFGFPIQLGRFSATGALEGAEFPEAVGGMSLIAHPSYTFIDLVTIHATNPSPIIVLTGPDPAIGESAVSRLFVFEATVPFPGYITTSPRTFDHAITAISDAEDPERFFIELATASGALEPYSGESSVLGSNTPLSVASSSRATVRAILQSGAEWVALESGPEPRIHVTRGGREIASTTVDIGGARATPVALAPWPRGGLMLTAFLSADGYAYAALLDPAIGALLGDPVAIGTGAVRRFVWDRTDPAGPIWGLLPWTAELVRIQP
jgi:hypothetical protein